MISYCTENSWNRIQLIIREVMEQTSKTSNKRLIKVNHRKDGAQSHWSNSRDNRDMKAGLPGGYSISL